MKLKLRNNKGITLVALVVTIVVLLILAGISLSLVLGENGIIAKAKEAKQKTEQDAENTTTSLDNLYAEMLEEIEGEAQKDDWYEVTDTIDLTGITEYHVTNCTELKMLANTVNAGNNFEGITVYLDKNLDLQGNESKQWTPIGTGEYIEGSGNITFNGTFNGQNHYISGMYINSDEIAYAGLFGYVDGNASILNLGINGYVSSGACTGGIVGYVHYNSTVENCRNMSEISSGGNAGGIVGMMAGGAIENCYNGGKISCGAGGDAAGGIIGDADLDCTVKNCYNSGEIISEDTYAGGVIGWNEEGNLNIENCYNLGKVSGKYAGGIIGDLQQSSSMSNCYNLGLIEGTTKGEIAGVTSNATEEYPTSISNCYFLSSSTNEAIGEITDSATTTNVISKTETEMKSADFVTLLNNGGTAWKLDSNNINNGYPILSWQK